MAPANVEEIQAVIRIANRYRIPFWVNSTGKNFGYGGPAGVVNGTVNLDLKRMNRILEVNEANAYALVEPGVSFFEMYRYLPERNIKLWLDVRSPGWGSIIGNTIEYGLGYTDQGQRVNFLCGMEVVLPNGEVMRTGQGAIPDGVTWQHYRRSIGPRIDKLFCQTNYGVVTRMGIWLRPEPPAYLACSIMTDRNEKIIPMIDTMRPLRLGGIINNNATLYRHPFVQEGEENPENPGGWNNRVAFYGLEGVVKQHWEHVRDAYNDAMPGTTFASNLYTTPYDLDSLGRSPDRLMAGIPSLGSSLHKNYFSMALPFDGQAAWDLILLLDEASKRHGRRYFGMAHHVETPHEMVTTSSALLRPGDDDYNQTTMRMIRDWIVSTGEKGLGPNRVSTPYMDDAMAQFSFNDHRLLRFHEELKDVIDPNGIMAPGKKRYLASPHAGEPRMNRTLILRAGLPFALLLCANGAAAQDELIERGRTVYEDWCAICHAPGEGATLILEERYQGALHAVVDQRTNLTEELIVARVRTWVAPQMPPFRQSEVSDADLEAVIAYLKRNDE